MRRSSILEGIKSFIVSKPPLIVFTLCLICFFITLVTLMIYLNTHDLKNPDIIDWNSFKQSLASLNYCVKLSNEKDTQNNLNQLSTKPSTNEKIVSFSFQTQLTLRINDGSLPIDDISSLYGKIEAHEIGLLQGHYKSEETIYASFHLIDSQDIRFKYELKQSSELCKNKNNPLNKHKLNDCSAITVKVCANLVGPRYMFPNSKAPISCAIRQDIEKNHRYFTAFKETPDLPLQFQCPSTQGIKGKVDYKVDPNLTVMLSRKDKETINRHLRTCMYLLSIFTTLIIVYGVMKGRKKQTIIYQPVSEILFYDNAISTLSYYCKEAASENREKIKTPKHHIRRPKTQESTIYSRKIDTARSELTKKGESVINGDFIQQ